jgi:hypothetical protein
MYTIHPWFGGTSLPPKKLELFYDLEMFSTPIVKQEDLGEAILLEEINSNLLSQDKVIKKI